MLAMLTSVPLVAGQAKSAAYQKWIVKQPLTTNEQGSEAAWKDGWARPCPCIIDEGGMDCGLVVEDFVSVRQVGITTEAGEL